MARAVGLGTGATDTGHQRRTAIIVPLGLIGAVPSYWRYPGNLKRGGEGQEGLGKAS